MSIITEKTYSEQSTVKTVSNFFKQYVTIHTLTQSKQDREGVTLRSTYSERSQERKRA